MTHDQIVRQEIDNLKRQRAELADQTSSLQIQDAAIRAAIDHLERIKAMPNVVGPAFRPLTPKR